MSISNVTSELEHMSISARLDLIERLLALIRADLSRDPRSGSLSDRRAQLAGAAAKLRQDYMTDDELTTFASLDAEDFHAAE